MAEQPTQPTPVVIEYRTPDERFGQRFGVASVADALTFHPDAIIVTYADGTPFEGKEAKAEVREAKAELKAEAEAAEAEPETPKKSTRAADKAADEGKA